MFFRLYLSWQLVDSSLQLLIQPWSCAPGTHYGWVDWGSVEYEVCPTLLHVNSTGNRTPDPLILNSPPYPLGNMLYSYRVHISSILVRSWTNILEWTQLLQIIILFTLITKQNSRNQGYIYQDCQQEMDQNNSLILKLNTICNLLSPLTP